VFPGETLITEGWHIGQGKYVTRTTTQDGRIVLGNATAEIAA
jgi:acyl dehydratase